MSANIISQIWTGVVTTWDKAEAWIDTQVARVEAVLPGAASPIASDLKQLASDAVGAAAQAEATFEPALVTGIETLADAALTKVTGGLALPLVQMTNDGIANIAAKGQAAIQAWALKAQAALAENNSARGGGTPVSPVGPAPVLPQ